MNKKQNNEKFNWGTGITVAIILFITATLTMVGFLISLDFEMVTENHYEKAVSYQNHINRIEQASMLETPVEIRLVENSSTIKIQFPQTLRISDIKGSITLYRPDNSELDQQLELSLNSEGMQFLPTENLKKGKWQIKINWSDSKSSYFSEQQLFL